MPKPKPEMLGTGAAARAGKKIKSRRSRIDSYVDSAARGKKKKKK